MNRFLQVSISSIAFLLALAASVRAEAQTSSIDLTVNDIGLSVGDSPRITGMRVNYRDRQMSQVTGMNATVFSSKQTGRITGIALGLPATGAREIAGIGIGAARVNAGSQLRGIMLAGLSVGAGSARSGLPGSVPSGGSVDGIAIAGLSVGARGYLRGVAISTVVTAVPESRQSGIPAGIDGISIGVGGVYSPGEVRGLTVGGLFAGGGNLTGITATSGILNVQHRLTGISAGGLVVAAEQIRGITATAGFLRARDDIVGITAAGVMARSERIRGLTAAGFRLSAGEIGGLAVAGGFVNGARSLTGVAMSAVVLSDDFHGIGLGGVVGGRDLTGAFAAAVGVSVNSAGTLRGVAVSPFNAIHGTQRGLTIGIINSAKHLHGAQIGLINVAGNNPKGRRVLPLVNWHRD